MMPLPSEAADIYVEWLTAEGGLGVISFTDDKGSPFIGLHLLDRQGKANGLPCWFRRSRLMSDVVIGFRGQEPLVVFIDIEVNARGLSLIVCVPFRTALDQHRRHFFAPWGSDPPHYGFKTFPANTNWPSLSFPWSLAHNSEQGLSKI